MLYSIFGISENQSKHHFNSKHKSAQRTKLPLIHKPTSIANTPIEKLIFAI